MFLVWQKGFQIRNLFLYPPAQDLSYCFHLYRKAFHPKIKTMKLKIATLASVLLLTQLSYGQITNPAPYCAAGYDDEGGPFPHYISNVTLGSLNNTSGDTQFVAPHYVYYTNITAPVLAAGNTYNLSVSHDGPPASVHFVVAYIDYNHNNSFADTGERVLQQKASTGIANPSMATITVPATATPGITRMRVMVFEDDSYTATNATPCTADATGFLNWGETEDYNVNITAPTGITEIGKSNNSLCYPNPANDFVYVDQRLNGNEMTLYNIEGKAVQHGLIENKRIDVSSMAPGLYIIKVIGDKGVYTQRLTIVKQ
jgi:hypothetical protein